MSYQDSPHNNEVPRTNPMFDVDDRPSRSDVEDPDGPELTRAMVAALDAVSPPRRIRPEDPNDPDPF